MNNIRMPLLVAMAATLVLPVAAFGQAKLYKWTDANGNVHYTDKVPTEAAGRAREELNKQGTVMRRTDAALTAEQRAELERDKKRKVEEDNAAREQKRKDMALLNTYSTERDIEEARGRALKANEEAIKEAERKVAAAQKRGEKLKAEAEFYAKKPMPKPLQQDISVNDLEIKTQTELIDIKRKEVAAINAKYDDDKRRFLDLTKPKTAQGLTTTSTATR
jgi:flagellar biosynthesis GTPase FlhF